MKFIAIQVFAVGSLGDGFWNVFGPSLVAAIVSSAISLTSAFYIFYRKPTQNRKIDTTIKLIEQYNSEEMEAARRDVWLFLNDPQAQTRADNIKEFCAWVYDSDSNGGANTATYQKTMRLLNFFAIVEVCLAHNQVVPSVLHAGLAYSYAAWRKVILEPVRQKLQSIEKHKHHPSWRAAFIHLDSLIVDYSR